MTPAELRRIAEAAASVRTYTEEYAEFIATFNPKRVLELLDQIEQLQAVVRDKHDECTYQARLAAVGKLHQPVEAKASNGDAIMVCEHCVGDLAYVFDGQVNWPCDTIKAVRGE